MATARIASPFRGIHPFLYRDRQLFFGREEIVSEMLVKIMLSRLVVLYGESGTGKSSMLAAGLVPRLQKERYRPERLLVEPDGPIIVERIEADEEGSYLPSIFSDETRSSGDKTARLAFTVAEFVRRVRESTSETCRPVLMFDQFEQLFTLFERKHENLQQEVLRAIFDLANDDALRVKIVISMREDFLGKLEVLAKAYPRVFDNRVRLQELHPDGAKLALSAPFAPLEPPDAPNPFASRFDDKLIDRIVVDLSADGQTNLVHPTKLQIVASSLWDSFASKKALIDGEDYDSMKGMAGILEGYFHERLKGMGDVQRANILRLLGSLVTESGTRDVVSWGKVTSLLVGANKMTREELDEAHRSVSGMRLVNATPRSNTVYLEIASEYLIPPVQREMEQIRVAEERQQAAEDERKVQEAAKTQAKLRQGRWFKGLAFTLAAAVAVAAFGWVEALLNSRLAQEQTRIAEAQAKLAKAETRRAEDQTRQTRDALSLAEAEKQKAQAQTRIAEEKTDLATKSQAALERRTAELDRANRNLKEALARIEALQRETDKARTRAEINGQRHLASGLRARAISHTSTDPQLALHLALGSLAAASKLPEGDDSMAQGRLEAEQTLNALLHALPPLPHVPRRSTVLAAFPAESVQADAVAVSTDGKRLALADACGGVVVRDTRLEEVLTTSARGCPASGSPPLARLAFSADGRNLSIARADGWELWDIDKRPYPLKSAPDAERWGRVRDVALSRNGRFVATLGEDGRVVVEEVGAPANTRKPSRFLAEGAVRLAVSSAGDMVAIARAGGDIELVAADGIRRWQSMPPVGSRRAAVTALAFASDDASAEEEKNVAVLYQDGRIRFFETTRRLASLGLTSQRHTWEQFHAGADRLMAGAGTITTATPDGSAKTRSARGDVVWEGAEDGRVLATWRQRSRPAVAVVWKPERKQIALVEQMADGLPRGTAKIALSPDGRRLAALSPTAVEIHSTWLGIRLLRLPLEGAEISVLAFSPDGRMVVGGTEKGSIRGWNAWSGELLFEGNFETRDAVLTIAFAPGGEIVTGDDCGNVLSWDAKGQLQKARSFPEQECWSIYTTQLSADGRQLFTGNQFGEVHVLDMSTRRNAQPPLRVGGEDRKRITSLALARNGAMLAVLASDGLVELWHKDGPDRRWSRKLGPEIKEIAALMPSPGEHHFMTLSRGGVLERWSMADGKSERIAMGITRGERPAYALDGKTIAIAQPADRVRVYSLDPAHVVGQTLMRVKRPLSEQECASAMLSQLRPCDSDVVVTTALAKAAEQSARMDFSGVKAAYERLQSQHPSVFKGAGAPLQQALAEFHMLVAYEHIRAGDRSGAMRALATAKAWDAALVADPARWVDDMGKGWESQARRAKVAAWVARGDELASDGHQEKAVAAYERALQLDPKAIPDRPDLRAGKRMAAGGADAAPVSAALTRAASVAQVLETPSASPQRLLIRQSVMLMMEGKAAQGLEAFRSARASDPRAPVDASDLNLICWGAALHGLAHAVVDTVCEEAVAAEPTSGNYRDSRGVARAIVGRTAQAIPDFIAYTNDARMPKPYRDQRQGWVDALRAGRNPFDEAELAKLRREL